MHKIKFVTDIRQGAYIRTSECIHGTSNLEEHKISFFVVDKCYSLITSAEIL